MNKATVYVTDEQLELIKKTGKTLEAFVERSVADSIQQTARIHARPKIKKHS